MMKRKTGKRRKDFGKYILNDFCAATSLNDEGEVRGYYVQHVCVQFLLGNC